MTLAKQLIGLVPSSYTIPRFSNGWMRLQRRARRRTPLSLRPSAGTAGPCGWPEGRMRAKSQSLDTWFENALHESLPRIPRSRTLLEAWFGLADMPDIFFINLVFCGSWRRAFQNKDDFVSSAFRLHSCVSHFSLLFSNFSGNIQHQVRATNFWMSDPFKRYPLDIT